MPRLRGGDGSQGRSSGRNREIPTNSNVVHKHRFR